MAVMIGATEGWMTKFSFEDCRSHRLFNSALPEAMLTAASSAIASLGTS
jgi:hypothetical protein